MLHNNSTKKKWSVQEVQEKSLQTPHTLDIIYLNSSPLVGATDHCSPKRPDTKTFLPPSCLTTKQLTHCSIYSIYIYPCTSCTLHFFFALLLCNISQLLYISHSALYIYILNFLDRCTVALFVLYCVVMYILCKHIESHSAKSNSLFVQTHVANKT